MTVSFNIYLKQQFRMFENKVDLKGSISRSPVSELIRYLYIINTQFMGEGKIQKGSSFKILEAQTQFDLEVQSQGHQFSN